MDSLFLDDNVNFLFVGGKGGVGKTTTSSSIACQLALNRRVLLLSTDPAHSLGDAFLMNFSARIPSKSEYQRGCRPVKIDSIPNLDVLEINPPEYLEAELAGWADLAKEAGVIDLKTKIEEVNSWVSNIPGIDEATALSSVIKFVDSGRYDIVVFDTAPTGHTLKLLQLPYVLDAALSKLESWQSTAWTFWEMFKTADISRGRIEKVKKGVSMKLREYKKGIERVGVMMRDTKKCAFVVVCIAEYLSVMETERLLLELTKNGIRISHVVLNQLMNCKFSETEIKEFSASIGSTCTPSEEELRIRVLESVRLSSARSNIQEKYQKHLKESIEAISTNIGVIEVVLRPYEVTGPSRLLDLGRSLLSQNWVTPPKVQIQHCSDMDEFLTPMKPAYVTADEISNFSDCEIYEGDSVVVKGLKKSAHHNGKNGIVESVSEDGRILVRIEGDGKLLSLRRENVIMKTSEPNFI